MNTRLLSLLIAFAIATFALGGVAGLGAEGAQAQEMMPSKTGDLNMDGTANSLDALIVLFIRRWPERAAARHRGVDGHGRHRL